MRHKISEIIILNRKYAKKKKSDRQQVKTPTDNGAIVSPSKSSSNIRVNPSVLQKRNFPPNLLDSIDSEQIYLLSDNNQYSSFMGFDRQGKSILMIDGVSPNITAMATDLLTQIKQSNLFTGNNYDPVTSFSETIVIVTKKTYDNIAEAEYLVQRLLEGINAQSKERKQYKSDRTEEPTTANNQIALTFHLQEKSGYVDDETKIYSDDTVYIKSKRNRKTESNKNAIVKEIRLRELTQVEIIIDDDQTLNEQIYYPSAINR